MISINDAASQGIDRLRQPQWANDLIHLQITINNGKPGPKTYLWSPLHAVAGMPDPAESKIEHKDLQEQVWEPYTGPLPEDVNYKNNKNKVKKI